MMDRRVAAATLLALLLAATAPRLDVHALSSGAPNYPSTCTTLLPSHEGTLPLAGPPPFTMAPAQGNVAHGDALNITLTSRQGFPFKGFLVKAHAPDSQQPIGSFIVHDAENTHTIDCLGGTENAVTHSNPSLKKSTTFEWVPPPEFNGPVVFNATVVQNYSLFWSSVMARAMVGDPAAGDTGSTVVGISTTQRPLTTQRTSTTAAPVTSRPLQNYRALSPIYVGCSSSKACFGYPANCESNGNCDFMATVLERQSKYEFELMTTIKDGKYAAVGLSNDKYMSEDLVMECVLTSSGEVKVFQSWNIKPNPRKGNERIPTNELNLLTSSYNDSTIYCKFDRSAVTTVKGVEFNMQETKYFLLLASGTLLKAGDAVGFHVQGVSSDGKALLSDVTGFHLASKLLLRLHGAFMIGAWIGAASIGIVLARYFKQTWTGSQLCGKDQWFAWHRLFMMLVWSLTIAAFVIIFVELKAWSASADKHAILGVITTALAFLQPIGAIFRPSPDSRRRPIFNWVHWFVGNCAHIFGIVSIFLAGQLQKAELPRWWIWIMVGYVAFHVLMHLMFSIAGCISERQSNKRINSFPMKEITNSRSPLASAERKQEAPHSCFRKFLLAVYIFGILVITIALIVIAVMAPIEEHFKRFQNFIANTNSSG